MHASERDKYIIKTSCDFFFVIIFVYILLLLLKAITSWLWICFFFATIQNLPKMMTFDLLINSRVLNELIIQFMSSLNDRTKTNNTWSSHISYSLTQHSKTINNRRLIVWWRHGNDNFILHSYFYLTVIHTVNYTRLYLL